LRGAAASGAVRVRAKMAQATELALLFGSQQVNEALSRAAGAGRFGEDDLVSILSHAHRSQPLHVVRADESFSAQQGTSTWEGFGRRASCGRSHHSGHPLLPPGATDRRGRTMRTPEAPPLPAELDALLKRMRLPYFRRVAPEVCATARAQRWEPAEVLRVLLA